MIHSAFPSICSRKPPPSLSSFLVLLCVFTPQNTNPLHSVIEEGRFPLVARTNYLLAYFFCYHNFLFMSPKPCHPNTAFKLPLFTCLVISIGSLRLKTYVLTSWTMSHWGDWQWMATWVLVFHVLWMNELASANFLSHLCGTLTTPTHCISLFTKLKLSHVGQSTSHLEGWEASTFCPGQSPLHLNACCSGLFIFAGSHS